MRKCLFMVMALLVFLPASAKAESQDACAIWLCLPGGFPSGCSGAHSEFKHRIKKGKPPLPPLANCTVDGKTDGRYEMGREIWENVPFIVKRILLFILEGNTYQVAITLRVII